MSAGAAGRRPAGTSPVAGPRRGAGLSGAGRRGVAARRVGALSACGASAAGRRGRLGGCCAADVCWGPGFAAGGRLWSGASGNGAAAVVRRGWRGRGVRG
ncbi:hypothetical protein ACWED2_19280 [Amycolatopsis sp. NPDC005003]